MSSGTSESPSAATNGSRPSGAEAAEHERQFREILEFCPAALLVVDEDGRLLFHNARLRELLGYQKDELDRFDTTHVLARPRSARADHRLVARARRPASQRKGRLADQERPALDLLLSYVQVAYQGGHISFVGGKRVLWVYDITALTQHETQVVEQERQLQRNPGLLPGRGLRGR